MQEQTAHLHRQFLDGQDMAHRTVHLLVEQQQRLLQTSLGLPAAPLTALPPVAAPAPFPAPLPPLAPRPVAPPVMAAKPQPAALVAQPPLAPVPLAPKPSPFPVPSATSPRVEQILLDVIAEKTGYPTEMLELDMALDADLGIDSIKRVEILSALQERLPEPPSSSQNTLARCTISVRSSPSLADPQMDTRCLRLRSSKRWHRQASNRSCST